MGSGRDDSDPLAELARLVGQDDPYGKVFRPASAAPPVHQAAPHEDGLHADDVHPDDVHPDDLHEGAWHEDAASSADHRWPPHPGATRVEQGGDWHGHPGPVHYDQHPAGAETWSEHDETQARDQAYADDERYYAVEAAAHRDDAGIAEAATAVDGAEASIPDIWARGSAGGGAAPQIDQSYNPDAGRARESGSARRPLLVLGAVLLLTAGGLGASFLAKSDRSASVAATSASGAPTILAATGPTKIKQDDPSATAPEDKDAALLNKGAGAVTGPARVVQSEEQPADLTQLPKTADAAAIAQSPSPFPEAKKVKTFVVHPDGTPMYDDGQSTADAAAQPPAGGTIQAGPASTPNSAGRGTSTPASPSIASLMAGAPQAADAAADPDAAAQASAADAVKAKAAKTKPIASTETGGFGLQLAASPSEADAHAAFAKLKKKYPSELGSLSAKVHQSDTGGKPVYRVRVGGMTREEASGLCSKLMAGGGSCFVVHD